MDILSMNDYGEKVNRKIAAAMPLLLAFILLVLLTVLPISADGGAPRDRASVIVAAADRLVSLQNTDGGFDWYPDNNPATGSTTNTLGITAIGILKAHELVDKAEYETALAKAYKYVVEKPPVYTWDNSKGKYVESTAGVDSCPDITFLVWLAQASARDASLLSAIQGQVPSTTAENIAAFAKGRWDNRVLYLGSTQQSPPNGTATRLAQYIRDSRHSQNYDAIIPWDLELGVKAALALDNYYPGQGYENQAKEIAEVIYASVDDENEIYFSSTDNTQEEYVLGLTGAIEAFVEAGLHLDKAASLKGLLIAIQQADGSWKYYGATPVEKSVQSTAYAVMALFRQGDIDAVNAARRAADWLVKNQRDDGGWYAEGGAGREYLEVDSEAALALVSMPAPVTVGTKEYYSIQPAVDAASPGDIVLVDPGVYHESVVIYKEGLTVRSTDGAANTVIVAVPRCTGSNYHQNNKYYTFGVQVIADNVTFEGFTVAGADGWNSAGILVGDHMGMENSVLHPNYPYGEHTYQGKPVTGAIIKNNIVENNDHGIYLFSAHNCLVDNNIVRNSTTVNQSEGGGNGIIVWGGVEGGYFSATGNRISNSEVYNNDRYGIFVGAWPGSVDFDGTVIERNLLYNNYRHMIHQVETDIGICSALGSIQVTANKVSKPNLIYAPNVSVTWEVAETPAPYQYDIIQDAIDNAGSGDTVLVYPGTYDENIDITKNNLTLLGAQHDVDPRPVSGGRSGAESIITSTARDEVIYIDADNVVVNGFTIKYELNQPGAGDWDLVYQDKPHSGTVVKYNIVTALVDGVPTVNSDDGIQLKKCTDGVIEYNYAHHIKANGFNFANSTNCIIRYNEGHHLGMIDHPEWGGAIYTYKSTNIDVIGNKIYDALGITIGSAESWPNLRNAGGKVEGNTVENATFDGLEIYADNVLIKNNEIYDCGGNAIKIIGADVIAQYNDLHNNNVGILVKDNVPIASTDISVHWNNIKGNTQYGINNEAAQIVDATLNWWGTADNREISLKISGRVMFEPWLPRQLPAITGIYVSRITTTGATIGWTTAVPASSRIEYGRTTAYGMSSSIPGLTALHSLSLAGLDPSTTYHFRVISEDAYGHVDISEDMTFTTPTPDFAMTVSPSSGSVLQGESTSSAVSITSSWGFAATVRLSAAGLPAGAAAAFSPSSGTPSFDSMLRISTTTTTPAGTYSITITGTGGGRSHSTTFFLTVIALPRKATLTVDTVPIKASVYVDGLLWGTSPQTRSIDAGAHTISFGDVLGYLTPAPQTVTLAENETRIVVGTYTEIPPENVENQSPAYEIPSITPEENATIEVENTALTEITIQVEEAAENVSITVQEVTEGTAGMAIGAPGATYKYLNIVAENITDEQIGSVVIRFKVEKSWIISNDIDIATIALHRLDPLTGEWVILQTTFLSEDDTYVYFSAVSPGLSLFAISGQPVRRDFTISVRPDSGSVAQGDSVTTIVSLESINEFREEVTLSASGLPPDAVAVFSPASGTPSFTSELTVSTGPATPTGIYTITITGMGGGKTNTTTYTLTVTTPVVRPTPVPDFTLSVSPTSGSIVQGESTSATVVVSPAAGFASTVTLSATGLPPGGEATFSPGSGVPSFTSLLTVSTTPTTPPGVYSITITGTGGGITHTVVYVLTITALPPAPDFSISVSPAFGTVVQGDSITATVTLTSIAGFSETVDLTASGLPPDATASLIPTSGVPSFGATLTISTAPTTPPGTYTVILTGAGGGKTRSTAFSLTVTAVPQAPALIPLEAGILGAGVLIIAVIVALGLLEVGPFSKGVKAMVAIAKAFMGKDVQKDGAGVGIERSFPRCLQNRNINEEMGSGGFWMVGGDKVR